MKSLEFFAVVVVVAACGSLAGRPGCNLALSKTDDAFEFSASSHKFNLEPSKAQRDAPKAWCAEGEIKFKEYLQIKLSRIRHISAVEISGHKSSYRAFYVKSFLLGYSMDGKKWKFYKSRAKKRKQAMFWTQFVGNKDTVNSKWNYLDPSFLAKHIRLYPLTFKNGMCMKLELYGCNKTIDCTHIIKLEEGENAVVKSPNYPKPYPNAANCNWFFYLPQPDTPITIITLDFDVGTGNPNRTTQYVELYKDVYPFSKHLTGVYYDSAKEMMPRVMKSSNKYLRIAFDAGKNNTLQRRGFHMIIWASHEDVKTAEGCDNTTISLNCSDHERTIGVSGVFYGQYQHSNMCNINTSQADPQLSKKSCRVPDTLPKLQESCDYRNICSVVVQDQGTSPQCSATRPMQMFVVYHCSAIKPTTLPTTTATTSPPKVQIIPTTSQESTPSVQGTEEPTAPHETSKILVVQQDEGVGTPIILIAAGCGAGVVIIIIIAVTLYCLCCKKSRKDIKDDFPKGIPPSESNTSKVMIESESFYETIDDFDLAKVRRYETEGNRYSPLLGVQHGMSNNPLYQKSENPLYQKSDNPLYENGPVPKLSSSCDSAVKVQYIGASCTSVKIPTSVPEPSYIDVQSPQELPSNSIPMAKYLEPACSPPDHTAITITAERYVSSPPSSVASVEDHYETMNGSVA